MLETPQIAIHNVTFEPGCRNNWHIHHNAAQVLIAVGGCGYYQIEDRSQRELKAGQGRLHPQRIRSTGMAPPRRIMLTSAFMVPVDIRHPCKRMARAGGC